jgi:hypothetical protein
MLKANRAESNMLIHMAKANTSLGETSLPRFSTWLVVSPTLALAGIAVYCLAHLPGLGLLVFVAGFLLALAIVVGRICQKLGSHPRRLAQADLVFGVLVLAGVTVSYAVEFLAYHGLF